MRELLRKVYYKLVSGRIVLLEKPAILRGKKWKIDTVAGRSYWKGYYEPPITNFLLQQLSDNSVFFDIGSNVGYFSLLAAVKSPNGQVHSFEPDKITFDYSESIRKLNKLSNWTSNNKGVGKRTETLFFKSGLTTTTGIITEGNGETVSITSLDDYIEEIKIKKVSLLKIDVEGFGGNVLRGAKKLINTHRPTIIMEFHRGFDERDVFREIVLPHYNVFTLDGNKVDKDFKTDYEFVYATPKK